MPNAVTDTHGLIWYLEDSPLLGAQASSMFDASERGESTIFVPTICLVEMLYLEEKGRIPTPLRIQLEEVLSARDCNLILIDLTSAIVHKMADVPRASIPDMPDRIVAGTALYLKLPLISRDRQIRLSQIETIW